MAIIPFDTLDYSKTLQDAGISPAQADAFARAQKTAFGQMSEQAWQELATKSDLYALRTDMLDVKNELKADMAELRSDMATLRSDMRADMAALKHDILRWTLGFVIAMSGFLAGVMYFILRVMLNS